MRFERLIGLIALTALLVNRVPADVAAQTEWPNCENFLSQDDAQAAYDADRGDPFDLKSSEPVNDVPCEDEPAFGTEPLVSCDALGQYPDAQQALQGLYDSTRDDGDPYGLDQGGDPAIACDSGSGGADAQDPLDGPPPDTGGNDQEALDGPPPDTSQHDRADLDGPAAGTRSGTTVVVSAAPLDDVDDLGVRLDARFADLEAQFAAFEVRAQNGFGHFAESGDDGPREGDGGTVIVSTARPSATMTQPADTTTVGDQAVRLQTARQGGMLESTAPGRQKARNARKVKQGNEHRTSKRDRHHDGQRRRH
jgi:hypothetical protein